MVRKDVSGSRTARPEIRADQSVVDEFGLENRRRNVRLDQIGSRPPQQMFRLRIESCKLGVLVRERVEQLLSQTIGAFDIGLETGNVARVEYRDFSRVGNAIGTQQERSPVEQRGEGVRILAVIR